MRSVRQFFTDSLVVAFRRTVNQDFLLLTADLPLCYVVSLSFRFSIPEIFTPLLELMATYSVNQLLSSLGFFLAPDLVASIRPIRRCPGSKV